MEERNLKMSNLNQLKGLLDKLKKRRFRKIRNLFKYNYKKSNRSLRRLRQLSVALARKTFKISEHL